MIETRPGTHRRGPLRAALVALRPYQWVKNLLVLVPAVAAHRLHDPQVVAVAALAFVAFCLAASGIYVANDVSDAASDRLHPRKRFRPIAAGELAPSAGLAISGLALAGALLVAGVLISAPFAAMVLTYVVAAVAYSTRLKREPVVDVFALAGLYVVRVVAGGIATGITLSTWLLAFAMFLFLSLAFVKRYTELFLMKGAPLAGRGYIAGDDRWMPAIGISSGYMAVLVLALYMNAPEVTRLYSRPAALWLLCPMLLFWVTRMWFRASREVAHDDPLIEALRDPVTWVFGAVAVVIMYAAV